jgi:hypothetical protein
MTYTVTRQQCWEFGATVILRQIHDEVDGYAERLVVDGDEGRWVRQGPHGLHEVHHKGYAFFSEYWTGYFPVNVLVKLTECRHIDG